MINILFGQFCALLAATLPDFYLESQLHWYHVQSMSILDRICSGIVEICQSLACRESELWREESNTSWGKFQSWIRAYQIGMHQANQMQQMRSCLLQTQCMLGSPALGLEAKAQWKEVQSRQFYSSAHTSSFIFHRLAWLDRPSFWHHSPA